MKTALALIFTLLVAIAPAFASDENGPDARGPHGGGDRLARMQEHLDLSDEQVEKIRQIRESGGGREEIDAVLTEEQQAKLQERRDQMKGQGGKRGDRGRGGHKDKDNPGGNTQVP
jgi:Spy/CpxP family protein refolding chaperone